MEQDSSTLPANQLVCQLWLENEQGWGSRPDGYSLHKDDADAEAFIKEYWGRQPDGPTPSEYSRPEEDGMYIAQVSEEVYAAVLASVNGVRYYNGPLPDPSSEFVDD